MGWNISDQNDSAKNNEDFHKFLMQAELDVSKSYDQYTITLAGGALALSLTFLKDFASNPKHLWILAVAWGLLTVSITCVLASLVGSQDGLRREREINSHVALGRPAPANKAAAITDFLNKIAFTFLSFGLIFLGYFCVVNLSSAKEKPSDGTKKISEPSGEQ